VSRRGIELTGWAILAIAVTALLVSVRSVISDAHVALGYLLIVLAVSARMGRRVGLVASFVAFVAFNFFFIPPFYTLAIHHRLDWVVLIAFFAASTVATQMLHRAQAEATRAQQRAQEIDRLAAVGAAALNAARAIDAVSAVAHVIRAGLDVSACEIYQVDSDGSGAIFVAHSTRPAQNHSDDRSPDHPRADPRSRAIERAAEGLLIGETSDGTSYVAGTGESLSAGELAFTAETTALLLPLRVRERVIGVLRLYDDESLRLDVPQQRFAEALSYYAVLALERVRFAAEVEHAEALREADQLKDAMLASVSHDLRTPLTTIKALAHDIGEDGDDRAVVIEEEADRLNRFVSDLLDLSRMSAGAEYMNRELVAAEDVLGAALQRVSGAGDSHRIDARLDSDQPLLIGRFDFVHTLRALVNMIENALKYSPDQAIVHVTARRDGSWIAFEVADRGPGVARDDRDRIFEPFVRGADTGGRVGTGLGLAIARQAVELQGGAIRYEPRPGGGSIFTARLPIATEEDLAKMSL
jgi:two-component system sensor histidine kinase KdpD